MILFLICIHVFDFFADNTSLYISVYNPNNTAGILNAHLETIHSLAKTWLVKFNPSKSESLLVS